jgi:hypothetical protein
VNENLREYSNKTAINAAPYAYANNLATCSLYGHMLFEYMQQLQAKWLFVFSAFSGLTIHPGKIKATIVGKIHKKHDPWTKPDETQYCLSTLTVYDHQWKPTECSIDPTLTTYKYLGVHLDLHFTNTDTFNRQKRKAAAMLSHLLTQAGPSQAKIDYIRFKSCPSSCTRPKYPTGR